jgi:hypothetical protein
MNELWLPANLEKRHADFANAFELMESDRLMLLGEYYMLGFYLFLLCILPVWLILLLQKS